VKQSGVVQDFEEGIEGERERGKERERDRETERGRERSRERERGREKKREWWGEQGKGRDNTRGGRCARDRWHARTHDK